MKLVNIEIERFRSIKNQTAEGSIEFQGLDCLVGENNAGKTNILSAVRFLLREEKKPNDEELFWQKRDEEVVKVRGFFEISSEDLDRIKDVEKRDSVRDALISEYESYNRVLGICRQFDGEGDSSPSFKLLQRVPEDEDLRKSSIEEVRNKLWKKQKTDTNYSKADYRKEMADRYERLADIIPRDKQRNKGIWTSKYQEFVNQNEEELAMTIAPTDFPQGTVTVVREDLLPDVITIPAVKEMDSTTKRGGEVGELVDAISEGVKEELDKKLKAQLEGFDFQDHDGITKIENHITDHLSETFDDREVSFDFPSFSMNYIFSGADIKIDETHLDGSLSKENVGEGVKRTLIFSLLRTLADLQQGRLSVTTDEEDDKRKAPPLLILFEEAELYLYPQLQKQLLSALSKITDSQNQVIFSTHSPVLIDHTILDTINIVRKNDAEATTVTQFHSVLVREVDESDRPLVTDLNSVSEYIFSDQIVLVEGACDRIILQKLAPHLDSEWDFRTSGIPIMEVGGKSEVTRFHNFLSELGITTYSILDIDAVQDQIENISDEPASIELAEELQEAAEDEFDSSEYNHNNLPTEITHESWDNAFDRLEDLEEKIRNGNPVNESHADMVTKVLAACETKNITDILPASAVEEQRVALVEALLKENVLLLSGEIEDYYPRDQDMGKREAALAFDPKTDYENVEPRSFFQSLPNHERPDVDVFLQRVFEN
ncbi:AAA family ATPase [Halapricum salinum]|uniref:ATP-dependent endonuclease n=1 Tax=Halapricum salinum TaxID=1457250 RepID=A0A4D6HFA6_9EURY|nr:AAA family ATPase [Halapricum salinum]QCC51427.1 ATP-dependent endonuclease [Halapricum salinum]